MDRFAALSAFVAVFEQGGFAPAVRRQGASAGEYLLFHRVSSARVG